MNLVVDHSFHLVAINFHNVLVFLFFRCFLLTIFLIIELGQTNMKMSLSNRLNWLEPKIPLFTGHHQRLIIFCFIFKIFIYDNIVWN